MIILALQSNGECCFVITERKNAHCVKMQSIHCLCYVMSIHTCNCDITLRSSEIIIVSDTMHRATDSYVQWQLYTCTAM